MANDDLKSINDSLDKAIKLIRDEIALVNKNVKDQVSILHPRIDMIGARQELTNDKLDEVKETQEDHTRRLEALAGDTEQLLMDVKGIRDKEGMAHSRNKREIDEIKKHLDLPIIPDAPHSKQDVIVGERVISAKWRDTEAKKIESLSETTL